MDGPPLALDFVQIDVWDWERMAKFYQEILGLQPIFLEPEHRYGWLLAGPVKLALRGVSKKPEGSFSRTSLQFKVPDIDNAITQLEAKGCVFHDKQLSGTEGWKVAYFRDPEGNSIAVYCQEERGKT